VQVIELLSQNVGAFSLESVNHLVRRVASIGLNEQVYMVGTDRKSVDLPGGFTAPSRILNTLRSCFNSCLGAASGGDGLQIAPGLGR
jgi:hypothetical protein